MIATTALLCLSMAIYHEARSEPLLDQIGVGWVIVNRSNSGIYPSDICEVLTQPNQFPFKWVAPKDGAAWTTAAAIAQDILAGRIQDPTYGALHYYRKDIKRVWSQHMTKRSLGGAHVFMTEEK